MTGHKDLIQEQVRIRSEFGNVNKELTSKMTENMAALNYEKKIIKEAEQQLSSMSNAIASTLGRNSIDVSILSILSSSPYLCPYYLLLHICFHIIFFSISVSILSSSPYLCRYYLLLHIFICQFVFAAAKLQCNLFVSFVKQKRRLTNWKCKTKDAKKNMPQLSVTLKKSNQKQWTLGRTLVSIRQI